MSKIYKKSSHIYVNFPIINSRAVKNRTAAKTYVFIKIQMEIVCGRMKILPLFYMINYIKSLRSKGKQ